MDEVERLKDRVAGLEADLRSAVTVAFRRGAIDWTRLNYPSLYEHLMAEARATILAAEGTRPA